LRRIDPTGGPAPRGRGGALRPRDEPTRAGIAALGDLIDAATWARGRGWALSQAMIALPYYLHTYPAIVQQAWRWLAEALADS